MKHSTSKFFLSLLIVAAMAFSLTGVLLYSFAEPAVWDGSSLAPFDGGGGTESDPFTISDAQQLAYLGKLVSEKTDYFIGGAGEITDSDSAAALVYTGLADEGRASFDYVITSHDSKNYLYSEETGIAYELTAAPSLKTYYCYTIGGVDYYSDAVPANANSSPTFVYDAASYAVTMVPDITIFRSSSKYYLNSATGSYASTYKQLTAATVSFRDTDGTERSIVLFESSGNYGFSDVNRCLTVTREGRLYGRLSDGETEYLSIDSVNSGDNGNKSITIGNASVAASGSYNKAYYLLTDDIKLNTIHEDPKNWKELGAVNNWKPIGDKVAPFMGHFDGGSHTVYGLYVKADNIKLEYAGLFGYVDHADISRLKMSDGYIRIGLAAGSVVGYAVNSELTELSNLSVQMDIYKGRDSVKYYHASLHAYAGGIVGYLGGGCTVTDCENNASATAFNDSNSSGSYTLRAYAGGIAGEATASSAALANTIVNCKNTGAIFTQNGHDYHVTYSGGIVGHTKFVNVYGCINSAAVSAQSPGYSYAGGIVGYTDNATTVLSCINTALAQSLSGNKSHSSAGGIVSTANTGTTVENCISTVKPISFTAGMAGMIVGEVLNSQVNVRYNFFTEAETGAVGLEKAGMKQAENSIVTAEQLAGNSETVINAEGTYANTTSVVQAMNSFVFAKNANRSVTMHQGAELPEVYSIYYARYRVLPNSTETGTLVLVPGEISEFPDGFVKPEGFDSTSPVGQPVHFRAEPNSGHVVRSVGYTHGSAAEQIIFPDNSALYEFIMPAEDVTVNLYFVSTGADVFNIIYEDCEEVTVWSSYQYKAHFKGYTTAVPNPTRPGYIFNGWRINGSASAAKDVVLGAMDYSADITLTPDWTAKEDVIIVTAQQAFVYNEAEHAFVLSGASSGIGSFTVQYFADEVWSTRAPVNAGTYKVRITRPEDSVYKPFDITLDTGLVIDRADSSVTIDTDLSKMYNNMEVSDPKVTTVGDGTISFKYFDGNGTELDHLPKNAGTYKVRATISQGVNYKSQYAEREFVISKATVSEDSLSWTYEAPFEYNTEVHSVSVIGCPSDIQIEYGGTVSAKNAGTYTATVTFTVNENNYNPLTYPSLTWKIDRATIGTETLSWSDTEFTYDGTEKTVTVLGVPSDVTVKSYTSNKYTNAGTYTTEAVFEFDHANYVSVSIPALSWTIKKADYDCPDMHWTDADFSYDGTLHTVVLSGVPNDIRVSYTGNSYANAGEYTASAIFSGDENHNPIPTMILRWTVKRADTVIDAESKYVFDYDGTRKMPTVSINHNEADTEFSINDMVSMGTYTVSVTVPQTENYNAAFVTVKVIIKAPDHELVRDVNAKLAEFDAAETMRARRLALIEAYESLRLVNDTEDNDYQAAANGFVLRAGLYNRMIDEKNAVIEQSAVITLSHIRQKVNKPSIEAAIYDIKSKIG